MRGEGWHGDGHICPSIECLIEGNVFWKVLILPFYKIRYFWTSNLKMEIADTSEPACLTCLVWLLTRYIGDVWCLSLALLQYTRVGSGAGNMASNEAVSRIQEAAAGVIITPPVMSGNILSSITVHCYRRITDILESKYVTSLVVRVLLKKHWNVTDWNRVSYNLIGRSIKTSPDDYRGSAIDREHLTWI